MSNKDIKQELHKEIYEVMADNVDLNDSDLIACKSVIIDRLQNALFLINEIEE